MTKVDALRVINHQIELETNPVELLHWCWLRAIINEIPYNAWERYVEKATEVLSR